MNRASGEGPAPLRDVVERLKQIAAASADSLLLADGPPHPDWQLLDLAGEVLHLNRRVKAFYASGAALDRDMYQAEILAAEARITQCLRAALKLQAKTPAGIYAKALMVRSSKGGAKVLAMSLAAELVNCQALRESLWPAVIGEGA